MGLNNVPFSFGSSEREPNILLSFIDAQSIEEQYRIAQINIIGLRETVKSNLIIIKYLKSEKKETELYFNLAMSVAILEFIAIIAILVFQ